ncbi:MAG: alpha-galactosidase [Bryobacteraceae bacterium]
MLIAALLAFAMQPAPAPSASWKLATQDTELTIALDSGRPALTALRVPGGARSWIAAPLHETLMPLVEVNGTAVKTDWRYSGAAPESSKEQLVLLFTNKTPNLELKSIWRARPGHGPVEHWLTIENKSGSPVTVTHQDSLVLEGIAVGADRQADVWWVNRGGSNASREGGVFTVPVNSDLDQEISSNPRDPSSPVPWMAVQIGKSEGLYVGWEFSGIGRLYAAALPGPGGKLKLRVGNKPEFKTDIEAGEQFLVPAAFVGCYRGDLDEGSYTLHRFVLDKLLPPLPPGQPYPTLAYNVFLDAGGYAASDAVKSPTNETSLLKSARLCNDLGFETLVPDAMWYPSVGDWRWDPDRFPHGVKPILDYVRSVGMRLGLWCAWTNAGVSDYPGALNVKEHRDWLINRNVPDDWKPDPFVGQRICLASNESREWAAKETQRLVSDYGLDYLKHDIDPIQVRCEQTTHKHHYGVDVSYWNTLAYYDIQERLKQRFPQLALEGCSGGGHIKDYGYIKRVHYIVTTDTLSSLPNRQSIWDSTFVMPPAVLQAYTYENHYNKDSDRPRPYFWRTAMMSAWQIDPTNTASWSAEELAGTRRATQIYKDWIRPILLDAQVHHILPRPDDYHWDGMFYWSPSLKRGTVYIFRPNNDQQVQRVRLKGLATAKKYKVWGEDKSIDPAELTGAQLMSSGLRIKLPGKYTSDLIYIEAK